MIESVCLETIPCPLHCAIDDELVLIGRDRIHDLPGEFAVVKCRSCGLMRTNPRPTPETIGAYYPSEYGPYRTNSASPAISRERLKQNIKRWMGWEPHFIPAIPAGRMLEIGCASGAYMEKMRARGWIVEGIEFSDNAAQQARDKGLQVQTATLESADISIEPVDVVVAWMVLEHLHEPITGLRKIHDWIKPGGYLVASMPDAGALERRIFSKYWYALHLPNHLFHYTPRSIEKVLAAAGWKLERVVWEKNCTNLLFSLENLTRDKQLALVEAAVRWVRTSRKAKWMRGILAVLLGVTRQSGRMEIWARPVAAGAKATS